MLYKKRLQQLSGILKEESSGMLITEDDFIMESDFDVAHLEELENADDKLADEVTDPENDLKNYLAGYVSYLRAIHLWFHGAHHLTKGPGFAGDHAELYDRIYTEVQDEIDGAIEKAVGITEDENLGCPIMITQNAVDIIKEAGCSVNASADEIAESGLRLIKTYLEFVNEMFYNLEKADKLSLGLNDQLAASANTHETYAYLLGQRVKK